MKKDKKGFFAKMLSSEHRIFETSMFSISVLLSLALVIGIGYYVSFAYFDKDVITDEEANASSVTEGALAVTEKPEPTATPGGNVIVNEDDSAANIDEELATASEGYTTTTVNMRDDTSLTANVVVKVPSGTKLKFLGIKEKEWMKVEYNGNQGYINAMYLSVDKPKPIETVTPYPTAATVTKTPKPTKTPSTNKTPKPTKKPKPTKTPSAATEEPTEAPTEAPTEVPTQEPTQAPTQAPTEAPTKAPTEAPGGDASASAE